jgi:hypothetical protein
MLSWIIQMSIISIVFIFLIHHLLSFFKSTLTVPKVKDLVNSPTQKYQHIFDTLSKSSSSSSYTNIDILPTEMEDLNSSSSSMKNELKSFLKKQLNSEDSSNMNVMGLEVNTYGSVF